MRGRILFIFISVILLQVSTAGCSGKRDNKSSLQPNSTSSSDSKQSSTQEIRRVIPEESIPVVNDTVVDVFRQPATQSERVTQAIFNQPVSILEEKGNWIKIKVVDRYTGWVKSKYIDKESLRKYSDYRFRIVITAKSKKIYTQAKVGLTLKEVVMGTELFCTDEKDDWYKVALPGGAAGWIDGSSTIRIALDGPIPKTTANDFITTARKLLGTTYLWGGVSSWGIDCSGLTYICSRVNGVDLLRDADQQVNSGEKILIQDIMPGDILFFSTNTDLRDISHVGIYLGNDQFIHASNSRGSVVVGSITEDYFARRLVAIRRIF